MTFTLGGRFTFGLRRDGLAPHDGNVHRWRRVVRAGGVSWGAFAGWVAALCALLPLVDGSGLLPLVDGSGVVADASVLRGVGLVPVVLGMRLRVLLAWTRVELRL